MLFQGSTSLVVIAVELQETLRQLAIVETIGTQHIAYHGLVVTLCDECIYTLALIDMTGIVEGREEGEVVDVLEIFLLKVGRGDIVVGIDKLKHILKHTAGSTTGGHELRDVVTFAHVGLPSLYIGSCLFGCGLENAIAYRSCCTKAKEGKTSTKIVKLSLDLLFTDALGLEHLFVLGC